MDDEIFRVARAICRSYGHCQDHAHVCDRDEHDLCKPGLCAYPQLDAAKAAIAEIDASRKGEAKCP